MRFTSGNKNRYRNISLYDKATPSENTSSEGVFLWVVDRATRTESVSTYSMVEPSICNTCGLTLPATAQSHLRADGFRGVILGEVSSKNV